MSPVTRRPRRRPSDRWTVAQRGRCATLLDWVTPLELVPLTAWTYRLGATRPEFLDALARV